VLVAQRVDEGVADRARRFLAYLERESDGVGYEVGVRDLGQRDEEDAMIEVVD